MELGSIHGLQHVAHGPLVGRIFWAACCALSWGAAALLVLSSYQSYQAEPISFVVSTSYLGRDTRLPAVSVCETRNDAKTAEVARRVFGEAFDLNKQELVHDVGFFGADAPYLEKTCGARAQRRKGAANCSGLDPGAVAREVRSSCAQTLLGCAGLAADCCALFRPLRSELGACLTLGAAPPSLGLLLGTQEARVFVHSAADVPSGSAREAGALALEVGAGERHELLVAVHETRNDAGVEAVDEARRRCRFPWEGAPEPYDAYSYSACVVACRRREQRALCNCTVPLLPGGAPCDISGLLCVRAHYNKLARLVAPWAPQQGGLKCDCPAGCEDLQLDAILHRKSALAPWAPAVVEFRLDQPPSEHYARVLVRSPLDLVVSCGSAFGLFVGASLLSFVEIAYWLILRLRKGSRKTAKTGNVNQNSHVVAQHHRTVPDNFKLPVQYQ